jgi:D-aminoacyl-tRNA deacylase
VRALLQRVSRAEVRVADEVVARIGPGLLVFVGVRTRDDPSAGASMARRVAELRMFADEAGRTNRSLLDVGGAALVVSQFTLYADTRRGRRPGFTDAARPAEAIAAYESFCDALAGVGVRVERGRFGAAMAVELVNDGPFTIWLDGDERRPDDAI